jgi:hypothetical protein
VQSNGNELERTKFSVLAFCHYENYVDNQFTKRKGLLLSVLKAQSVISWSFCSWACDEVTQHGGSNTALLMARKQKRGRKGPESHYPLQGHVPMT